MQGHERPLEKCHALTVAPRQPGTNELDCCIYVAYTLET